MKKRQFLQYEESKVSYLRFGKGPKLLIAFHGFADRAVIFLPLRKALRNEYTIFSIDLPYNGQTEWKKSYFTQQDIAGIIRQILDAEQKDRFSLMGYSFGGRIAQTMLFEFHSQIDKIFLIAPDGIATHGFFNVTIMPRIMKKIVRWVMRGLLQKPRWAINLIDYLYRIKLISKFKHDFAYSHISTKVRRDRIFCTWLSLNDFVFSPDRIKDLLRETQIATELFFGKRDEIVPLYAGEWLAEGLPNVRLHVLDEGHLLIKDALCDLLSELQAQAESPQE